MTENKEATDILIEALQNARSSFDETLKTEGVDYDPAYFGLYLEGVLLGADMESVTERIKMKSRYSNDEVFQEND